MWMIIPGVKFCSEIVSTAFKMQICRPAAQGMEQKSLWQEQLCHTVLQTSENATITQIFLQNKALLSSYNH